jgi:lipopolysaccharide/colanic/teichoic acid biosynthesis glycosyltransferase
MTILRDLPPRDLPPMVPPVLPDVITFYLDHFLDPKVSHPSVNHVLKRGLDIIGACVGLGITALLLFPIALLIYIDDPGPIFYCQMRCGLKGKHFRLWKFRSMVRNADRLQSKIQNQARGHIFKNENDPRITRTGRWLRRTSLDELPQFWNILLGQMSLVGTRPPTPHEVAQYKLRHWARLAVKPGLTGEWQVNGRSKVIDFETVVDLDLRYVRNWSLGYDLWLMLKTIPVVLGMKGAC